jgi:16S rRNA (guanine527-N7)-methyltransferase
MQVGSEQWCALLVEGAAQAGIVLNTRQTAQMALYAQTLLAWNRKTNLTAITEPAQVAIKHFIDAIIPLPHIPEQGVLLDIGTGGGFPGVPLKIMRPSQAMTLIDASRKKINFVKHILRQLDLTGIEAIQSRVESFSQRPENQGRFQVIVSRAWADLETITQMANELLAINGRIIVYQGPGEDARRAQGGTASGKLSILKVLSYQLPIAGDSRTLVVMGKG